MNGNRQIPQAFKKFFWDADFAKLKFPEHRNYVLGKLMVYGDLDSIKWILDTFDRGTISRYLEKRGERTLDKKSYIFWTKILRMEELWHQM
jgi:hypothetical protein